MEVLGIIFLGIILFIFFGCLGWILKIVFVLFNVLFDGCMTSLGCLFWFILIFIILGCLI